MVLDSLTADQQEAIYYDKYYGMSTTRNLSIWVAASMSDQEAIETLKNHYWSGTSFKLDAKGLEEITGIASHLFEKVAILAEKLL